MTIVMMAELAGFAIAGIPAGSLVQRLGARRSMLGADALRAPLMMLVPVLHWAGHLSLGALVVLALLLGVLGAPYFTAQKVILPELIGEDEQTMSQANALFQGAIRATMLLGPPIGGVLIGLMGAANVLVVDAATYVVSFLLVIIFVPPRPRHGRGGRIARDPRGPEVPCPRAAAPHLDPAVRRRRCGLDGVFRRRSGPRHRALWGQRQDRGHAVRGLRRRRAQREHPLVPLLLARMDGLRLIALSVPFQAAPLWLLPLDVGAPSSSAPSSSAGSRTACAIRRSIRSGRLRMPAAIRPKAMAASTTIWGLGMPLGLIVAGPVLSAFGTGPVLVGFAAVQTVCMLGVAAASLNARGEAKPALALD